VELHNNLKDFITVDFSKNELKIKFNNANNFELTIFESELKQLEIDSNLAYKDELKKLVILCNLNENLDSIVKNYFVKKKIRY